MSSGGHIVPVWPFTRADPLKPPPQFADLRVACPISEVELWDGSRSLLATRYDDIKQLLRDPRLSSDTARAGFPQSSATLAAARAGQRSFNRMDAPDHGPQRRMLTRDFSIGEIQALRPYLEGLVDDMVDRILGSEPPVDLVRELAQPVPSHVICRLLDLPPADSVFFQDRINAWMNLESSPDESKLAGAEVLDYLTAVVADRRETPGDDLISNLIRTHLSTGEVSQSSLVHALHLLLVGGFDTTANMIALGTILLLRHPDQLADLRDHPELMPGAVEEMLRYLSVAHHVAFRLALDDIDIKGTYIHAGTGVIAPLAAANYDPDAFPHPDTFDVRRDARDHVAFGFGIHQCLGQHLARLELQIVFTALLARIPTLRLAIEPDRIRYKNAMIYGVDELPIAW
jgi:pentalenic acid synthase